VIARPTLLPLLAETTPVRLRHPRHLLTKYQKAVRYDSYVAGADYVEPVPESSGGGDEHEPGAGVVVLQLVELVSQHYLGSVGPDGRQPLNGGVQMGENRTPA
jgi:hypothetical protein